MLNGGVLPLDLLASRTDEWIRAEKRGSHSGSTDSIH
jgi:hypothetical protein